MIETINAVFPSRNFKVNKDEIEPTFLQRGERNTETWRNVKKVGYLLGDSKDIIRRKQLAISSLNKLQAVWIRRDYMSEKKRLRLYNCLVLPVLFYNCSTWELTKKDENMLDSFHWLQLRYIIGKKFHHIISNVNLYKRCKSYPISLFILKARWKLFGHVLRSDWKCPTNAGMVYYFEENGSKYYCGRPSTTIVTTLQKNTKRTLEKMLSFSIKSLKSSVDLQHVSELPQDQFFLLIFTRLLRKRNHTCVLSNRNSHGEEDSSPLYLAAAQSLWP